MRNKKRPDVRYKNIITKMYTSYIQKAISKAADLHRGQIRKGDGLPYIVHPFSVAWILSSYTNDEDIIIGFNLGLTKVSSRVIFQIYMLLRLRLSPVVF